jgi:WhiB family redox-sensing transcriptional regulator
VEVSDNLPKPTGQYLFSDEAVRTADFFKDVRYFRFSSVEDTTNDLVNPEELLAAYEKLPAYVSLKDAALFIGATDNWIKEEARSMGAELRIPRDDSDKTYIMYTKETVMAIYNTYRSIPLQGTALSLNELEARTGMRRERLEEKLPELGFDAMRRRSNQNKRASTFYDEAAEGTVNEYIESLSFAEEGWRTARAVGEMLHIGEARATRVLTPFKDEVRDMRASNHIVAPHYPPYAVEYAQAQIGKEQQIPYATEADIALKALAAVLGRSADWVTNRLPYVETELKDKRNPVNNRVFPYLSPNPEQALRNLPENVLSLDPGVFRSSEKLKARRELIAKRVLQLENQERIVRSLRMRLDSLRPTEDQQIVKKPKSYTVPRKIVLPIPEFRGASRRASKDWRDDAYCKGTDTEVFFPEKGGTTNDAKKMCALCEVRAECLEYAVENNEHFGVWGGLSEAERRNLRRKSR